MNKLFSEVLMLPHIFIEDNTFYHNIPDCFNELYELVICSKEQTNVLICKQSFVKRFVQKLFFVEFQF